MLRREVAIRRIKSECRCLCTVSLLLTSVLLSVMPLASQTHQQNTGERRVITRVEPEYPESLKRLYVGGVVRVEVVIAPNGVVKSTKLLGGSPYLGQSSMKAIKQWRYTEAATTETRIESLEFDSHR